MVSSKLRPPRIAPSQSRTIPVLVLAVLVFAILLCFCTPDERYVAAPAFACILAAFGLWMVLWDRDETLPLFDIGVFCATVTLVYSVYPLLNFYVDGLSFGVLSDARLQNYNPDAFELGAFHLRHVLYLFCFVITYAWFRGNTYRHCHNIDRPLPLLRKVTIFTFAIVNVYFIAMSLFANVSFNSSYTADIFESNFVRLLNTPLVIQQVSLKLLGVVLLIKMTLLALIFVEYGNVRWRLILWAWLGLELVMVLINKGARTNFIMFILAVILFYHRMIRPLSGKHLVFGALALFLFFNFLGMYREHYDFSSLMGHLDKAEAGFLSGNNEFQTLLGTSVDVLHMKESGVHIPWIVYFNDIVNILPPQQVMPFAKISAANWYLQQIGLDQTGYGFMWGVITQCIIGLDWLEIVLRASVLGLLLARVQHWYTRNQSSIIGTIFYAYLILKSHNSFRDTTFSILNCLVWEVLPFYILLRLCGCTGSESFQPGAKSARPSGLAQNGAED